MIFKYAAPKLTKYGKITEFIQAGSTALATGDVTGDGVPDTLFDTDGNGTGDLIVGGANGGQTPVTEFGNQYDADGDGLTAIRVDRGDLIPSTFQLPSFGFETAANDGWNDPARD